MSFPDYLPLSVDSSGGYVAPGKFFITGSDGVEIVATCHNDLDAAFIVRACNSHEALVKACDDALGLCIAFAATWAEQRGHALGDFHPIHAETIRQLRAALSLAEAK